MTNSLYFYLNGQLIEARYCQVSVGNRGYLLGEGLFETISVRDSAPRFLSKHLERLECSAAYFGYSLPKREHLAEAIYGVISVNRLDVGSLRLTVSPCESRGLLATEDSPLDILVSCRRGEPYARALYEQGLTAIIAQTTRRNEHSPLSRHKTSNFLDNVLAKKEALLRGADEALLLNSKGYLAEGAVSNLFLVRQGEVFTPRIEDGALPGVMRGRVIELCRANGIRLREVKIAPDMLNQAEEAFLTNALLGVMPLVKVDSSDFISAKPHSLSQRLRGMIEASG